MTETGLCDTGHEVGGRSASKPFFLTPPEVAEMLRVDQMKVHGWIKMGELQAINVASKGSKRPRWRIRQAALDAFLGGRTFVPTPPVRRRQQKRRQVTEFFK